MRWDESREAPTHHVEVLQARAVHDLQGPQVDHVQDLGLREKHLLVLGHHRPHRPQPPHAKDKTDVWGGGRAKRGQGENGDISVILSTIKIQFFKRLKNFSFSLKIFPFKELIFPHLKMPSTLTLCS